MTLQKKWEREFRGLRETWNIRSKTCWMTNGIISISQRIKKQR